MKKLYLLIIASFFAISIINAQATIDTQPEASPQLCDGGDLSLTVSASGIGVLSYIWQVYDSYMTMSWQPVAVASTFLEAQGIFLSGETSNNLTATNVGIAFQGLRLRCEVRLNAMNPVNSNEAVLNVNPLPTVVNQLDTLCENALGSGIADVDLTSYMADIFAGTPTASAWYEDSIATPIATPTNITSADGDDFWVEIDNGTCINYASVTITVNGLGAPVPFTSEICEDMGTPGIATNVDITAMNNTVDSDPAHTITWYSENTYSTLVPTPTDVTVNDNDIFYAEVTGGSCNAYATVTYSVGNTIPSNNQVIELCEDNFGSGKAKINISDYDIDINNNTGNAVAWYTDASRTLTLATPNSTDVTTGTTIYARISSGNCSSDAQADFTINSQPDVKVDTSFSMLRGCEPGDISFVPSLSTPMELINYKYRLTRDAETILNLDDSNPLTILNGFTGINIDTAGQYVFSVEDRTTGCVRKDTNDVTIQYVFQDEQISVVTYDPTIGKNIVVWNRTNDVGTDSFKIFSGAGASAEIGMQNFDDPSIFVDPTSPGGQAAEYALSLVDTCDHASLISTAHQAMLMTIDTVGGITIDWNDYVGLIYTEFYIHRGPDPLTLDSVIYIIDTITNDMATTNSWTDPMPPTGDTTLYYMISIKLPTIVDILNNGKKSSSGPFSRSLSNIEDNRQQSTGIKENNVSNMLSIYPNPFSDQATINYQINTTSDVRLDVINLLGQKVLGIVDQKQSSGIYNYEINKNQLESGIYFINLWVDNVPSTQKIIVK